MNKTLRNSIIIIGILIVLFAIIWFIYDMVKTEPVDSSHADMNLADENTGLDNLINELFENVVMNEESENKVQQSNTVEDTNKVDEQDKHESESITSKEEKAIVLVKKEWGGTEGVYFSNESIDSQGRYIVSVRDRGTTNSLAFFVVDVDTELVTKQ